MACPYCGNTLWDEFKVIGTETDGLLAGLTFLCHCTSCNRLFSTTEWYKATGKYESRKLTAEEQKEYGEW